MRILFIGDIVGGAGRRMVLEHLPMIELPIQYSGLLCPLVLVWYCITELGSITENAVRMGANVPGWLVKILAAGKEAVDSAGENNVDNK